jgi:spermidine synthase
MNLLRTAAFVFALLLVSRQDVPWIPIWLQLPLAAAVMALVSAGLGRAPLWLALCIGTSLVIRTGMVLQNEPTLLAHRSFYGRFTVLNVPELGGFHTLYNGSTLHGAQSMDPARRREPLTYYARGGPLGQLFAATAKKAGRRHVAVVGLGTGTLAAYSNAGEDWTFYEIDPGILRMASDRRYFTYLSDSPARMRVILGDARLSMASAPPHGYDLILVDAFNSDAIPVHLLTREALGVYLDKLAPGGIIMLHLSNRYLELESVTAALARDRGVVARIGESNLHGFFISASSWAGVARSDADFGPLARQWRPAQNRRHVAPWTDDFSSILSVWGK